MDATDGRTLLVVTDMPFGATMAESPTPGPEAAARLASAPPYKVLSHPPLHAHPASALRLASKALSACASLHAVTAPAACAQTHMILQLT